MRAGFHTLPAKQDSREWICAEKLLSRRRCSPALRPLGCGDPAAVEPRRLEAHRKRPPRRAGCRRRLDRRHGPAAGRASATAWGQSAVVENRSGGGGTIGTAEVVRSRPDGHTILIGNPGPNAIAYSIFKNLNYKPDQLQPVSNMIRIPNIVSAHPKTGIKSIAELIAYLKANPDKLSYASSGVGQSPHLTGAWFLQLTGLKMTHIPFRGAGPALQAALAGDIQILFDNLYPSLPQVQNGTLTGLCVTTTERSDLAPNLPTMRESAPELANFDVSSWFSVSCLRASPPSPRSAEPPGQGDARARRHEEAIAAMGARADTARRSSLPTSWTPRRRNSPASSRRKGCRWTCSRPRLWRRGFEPVEGQEYNRRQRDCQHCTRPGLPGASLRPAASWTDTVGRHQGAAANYIWSSDIIARVPQRPTKNRGSHRGFVVTCLRFSARGPRATAGPRCS